MRLFAFYIGGATENSLIELHDVRIIAAEKMEDCYEEIRQSWWGTEESLHLDCWGELVSADGHDIHLKPEPAVDDNKLWFVNLGGYNPSEFIELHKNIFVVAPTLPKAKVRALSMVTDWQSRHKDYQYELENITCLNGAAAGKGLHIHLSPTNTPTPFRFDFGYNPIFKKKASA